MLKRQVMLRRLAPSLVRLIGALAIAVSVQLLVGQLPSAPASASARVMDEGCPYNEPSEYWGFFVDHTHDCDHTGHLSLCGDLCDEYYSYGMDDQSTSGVDEPEPGSTVECYCCGTFIG